MDPTIRLLPADAVYTVYERLRQENPDPRSELHWKNVYTLLVAVVLSAQATDVGVNKATAPLFEKVDTPEQMLALGEEGLATAQSRLRHHGAQFLLLIRAQALEERDPGDNAVFHGDPPGG